MQNAEHSKAHQRLQGTYVNQPYATPVEKKTLNAVAAVAHAEAVPVPVFSRPVTWSIRRKLEPEKQE